MDRSHATSENVLRVNTCFILGKKKREKKISFRERSVRDNEIISSSIGD